VPNSLVDYEVVCAAWAMVHFCYHCIVNFNYGREHLMNRWRWPEKGRVR
jgi:hypothetical protein